MELQLVSKEVGELARDLGFMPEDPLNGAAIKVIKSNGKTVYKHWAHYVKTEIYLPEQELLAKWLRDVHNIIIYVEPFWRNEELGLEKAKPQWVGWTVILEYDETEPEYLDTYEEALEVVLLEGLNYLKQKLDNSKLNS